MDLEKKKKVARKKRIFYTILFIPDSNGRTFSIRVGKHFLYVLILAFAVFFLGIGFLIYKSGEIGAKLHLTYYIVKENASLKEKNNALLSIVQRLDSLEKTNLFLYKIALVLQDTTNKYSGDKLFSPLPTPQTLGTHDDDLQDEPASTPIVENQLSSTPIDDSASIQKMYATLPNITPVDGWITNYFIKNENQSKEENVHLGIDFAANMGSLIRSSAPGIVTSVTLDPYFGLIITIKHNASFITRYGHCLQSLVREGDAVNRGQAIALVGTSGRSTAPHLHYEIIRDGINVDPLSLIIEKLNF